MWEHIHSFIPKPDRNTWGLNYDIAEAPAKGDPMETITDFHWLATNVSLKIINKLMEFLEK